MKNKWLATCRQHVSVLRERNDCKFYETMLSFYQSLQWARAVSLWRDVSAGVEQKALCLTKVVLAQIPAVSHLLCRAQKNVLEKYLNRLTDGHL